MRELAYVFINPRTIMKSRFGGVLARYLGGTDLRLAAARMFCPSPKFAEGYAQCALEYADGTPEEAAAGLLADYVRREYAHNDSTGCPPHCICLLFEGEDAVRKIREITGPAAPVRRGCGQTVRETYGDCVINDKGETVYFEPAVLVGPTREFVERVLRLTEELIPDCSVIFNPQCPEKTLVMLKPDNFRLSSPRAGNIIDMLSSTGLRMIAVKKFSMTISQAEEFYGPVVRSLADRFRLSGAARVASAVSGALDITVEEHEARVLCNQIAVKFAKKQFEDIVEFMTGFRPSEVPVNERNSKAGAECLALVYEGENAIAKIRDILGATDPDKARPGSVRKEFGTNVMVNAAHASDSVENAEREMKIIDIFGDDISPLIREYSNR